MKTKKKIAFVIIITAITLNFFSKNRSYNSDIDLNTISSIAIASEETNTDPEEPPITVPTGIIDWLGELIGF